MQDEGREDQVREFVELRETMRIMKFRDCLS